MNGSLESLFVGVKITARSGSADNNESPNLPVSKGVKLYHF